MDGNPPGTPSGSPLVSPQWLAAHLEDPGLRILDARWLLGCRNGREFTADDRDGYRAGHIPGALFVGMQSELSDPDHPVPDMLAPPAQFARVMGRLGIGDDEQLFYPGLVVTASNQHLEATRSGGSADVGGLPLKSGLAGPWPLVVNPSVALGRASGLEKQEANRLFSRILQGRLVGLLTRGIRRINQPFAIEIPDKDIGVVLIPAAA